MFKITEIKELIRAIDRSSITELTIKGENKEQITIRRGGVADVVAAPFETAVPQAVVQVPQAPVHTEVTPAAPVAEAPAKETKPAADVTDANVHKIVSPMVGTFYAAPSPDSPPYAKVGDKVSADSVVCIVEAMKLMNELEAEMKLWERRPGPYVLQDDGKSKGKAFSTNQMWKAFDRERAKHPILKGAVPHGLRANAVIRLRVAGYSAPQISDMVGMSVEMVEHYCRHADRKASGQAILRDIKEQNGIATVKLLKNGNKK